MQPGAGGEIQLTDSIAALLKYEAVFAQEFEGVPRYDCGSKLGYLKATLAYGANTRKPVPAFGEYMQQFCQGQFKQIRHFRTLCSKLAGPRHCWRGPVFYHNEKCAKGACNFKLFAVGGIQVEYAGNYPGGTGMTNSPISRLRIVRSFRTLTAEPSGALTFGRIKDHNVVFLARHGYGHHPAARDQLPAPISGRWLLTRQPDCCGGIGRQYSQ